VRRAGAMMQTPPMEIAVVLGLLVVAVILFATEKLSVDVVTLLLLCALVLTGILQPAEAFQGFSSEIIVVLACIFVITGGLRRAGLLDALGFAAARLVGRRPALVTPVTMAVVGAVSAFMNNTTVTAMFLGPVIGLCERIGRSPSKLLMPLAFASILGGTCTLIGTSTNLAVSGYIRAAGLPPLGMFEFAGVGVIVLATGIAYFLLFGNRLLPDNPEEDLAVEYHIREYLSEIVVLPGSPLIGQSCRDSDLSILNFQILKVVRGEAEFGAESGERLREGDLLLVNGRADNLLKVSKIEGIELRHPERDAGSVLASTGARIAEILVLPKAEVAGLTLRESDFRRRSGLGVLAIYRHGHALRDRISEIPLREGDMLLVQGSPDRFAALQRSPDLAVLSTLELEPDRKRAGLWVAAAFAAAVTASALGWVPLPVGLILTALIAILSRCIPAEEAYRTIDWRLLILIGGMTAFGRAMEVSGSAAFLADHISAAVAPFGDLALLGAFFALTVILTQPMSNAAAALVVLPVALSTAEKMGLNERTFAIGIMLAGSISLITPFEPSCVIVYGPGKYRFRDFLRIGLPLTLLLAAIILPLLAWFWPLR
jgi:di/tricarboxylate transporter